MSFGFVNQERAREFREKQRQLKPLPMVPAINEAALELRKRSAQSAQRTTAHKLAARQLDGAVMPMRPTIKASKATLIARKLKAVRVRGQLVNSPPKTPPPSSPEEADDSINILAFICKRVPKSPEPDLSLDWDF